MYNLNYANGAIKDFTKLIGLYEHLYKDPEGDALIAEHGSEFPYRFSFDFYVSSEDLTNCNGFIHKLSMIAEKIRNSDVNDGFRKIALNAEREVAALRVENADLKRYRDFFEMQKELRSVGKK